MSHAYSDVIIVILTSSNDNKLPWGQSRFNDLQLPVPKLATLKNLYFRVRGEITVISAVKQVLRLIVYKVIWQGQDYVATYYNLFPQIRICGHRLQSVPTDLNLFPQIQICFHKFEYVATD